MIFDHDGILLLLIFFHLFLHQRNVALIFRKQILFEKSLDFGLVCFFALVFLFRPALILEIIQIEFLEYHFIALMLRGLKLSVLPRAELAHALYIKVLHHLQFFYQSFFLGLELGENFQQLFIVVD